MQKGYSTNKTGKARWKVIILLMLFVLPTLVTVPFSACADNGQAFSDNILTVTINSDMTVTLNWEDRLEDILYYVVERRIGNGPFLKIAYLSEDSTTYIDSIYSYYKDEIHTYRILACRYSYASYSYEYEYYSNEVSFRIDSVAAPTSLDVKAVSHTQINLEWEYPMNTSYTTIIERREAGSGVWTQIATVPPGVFVYEDRNLMPDRQYYYRVRAVSKLGIRSAFYPDNNTGIGAYTLLETPSRLSGRAVSPNRIYLSWNDVTRETGYVIERRMPGEDFRPITTVSANTTYYYDTQVVPDNIYIYRVKAVYQDGYRTNASNYTEILTVAAAVINAPSELRANITPYGEVELTWECNVNFESGFEIWRRSNDSKLWQKIAVVGRRDRSYIDSTNYPGILYYYRVRSFISLNGEYSEFSPEVTAGSVSIAAPDDLRYRILSTGRIMLEWNDMTRNETEYIVEYRSQPDMPWTTKAVLPANRTSFIDSGLSSGSVHYYRIKAVNSSYGSFAYSNEIAVDLNSPILPVITDIDVLSDSRLRIKWENTGNALSYQIQRRTENSSFITIAEVGPDADSYVDTDLEPSTRYFYRIRAYNKAGYSPYSIVSSAFTRSSVVIYDIENLGVFKTAVGDLASRGILDAFLEKSHFTGDGALFRPFDPVSRAEFVAMAVRAFSLEKTPVGSFADVTPGHPFYREIITAKRYGIIREDENGLFRPEEPITRQDACVILAEILRILDKPLEDHAPSTLVIYPDHMNVDKSAQYSVASCLAELILLPAEGTLIAPTRPLLRMEAARMIYMVIDR